jgi:hypothetical protein
LSFTFIKDIAGNAAIFKCTIILAWVTWVLSLTSTLLSYLSSQFALRRAIKILETEVEPKNIFGISHTLIPESLTHDDLQTVCRKTRNNPCQHILVSGRSWRGAGPAGTLYAPSAAEADDPVGTRPDQKRCHAVGIDLIRRILRQERDSNRLECLGRGPDARWRKI